jgi:hypothetical protein
MKRNEEEKDFTGKRSLLEEDKRKDHQSNG